MRDLSAPFMALLGLSFAVLAILGGLLTHAQNVNAVEASEHTFDALIADHFKRLSDIVLEYGYWDEAVEMIVYNYDPDWTEDTFSEYFDEILDIDGVYVVDNDRNVVMGFFRGRVDDKTVSERYGDGILPIIQRARNTGINSSVWPKLGITKGGKHYFMVAAMRMTTYLVESGIDIDRSTDHVMFLTQRLDAGFLEVIARKYLMPGLQIVDHPAGFWQADKEIIDQSGNVIGYFFWEPTLHGTLMIPKIGAGLAVVFVVMGVTAVLFFRRVARAAEELEAARETAENANQAKSDFLRNVTHEVRTPINAIVGFSTIMRDQVFGPIGNERYEEYIRDIIGAGDHVQQLVSDLLDLAKIEAGQMSYDIGPVDLREQIDSAISLIRPLAGERQVELSCTCVLDSSIVNSDPKAVRQILLNLFSNAIKFTPAGGKIVCEDGRVSDNLIWIDISDTGVGGPADQVDRILEPFGQVASAQKGAPKGSGLGLPITKKLTESLGGAFVFESQVGHGTTVKIGFPIAA